MDQMSGMDLRVGDTVRVTSSQYGDTIGGYRRIRLEPGDEVEVRRVGTYAAIVRKGDIGSLWVDFGNFERVVVDPNAPRPRRLGETPEGVVILDGEEVYPIGINDPRIQWLWDDLATFADKKNWCPQYDDLAKNIGIPGRKRDFKVKLTINGLELLTTVKARSQEEADATARATIGVAA